MDNSGVTTGVLTDKLVAVQAVSDSLTDFLRVSGELAAVKLEFAVAITEIGVILNFAGFHQIQAGIDSVSAAGLEQQINRTGLQLVHHGVVGNSLDNQGFDNGLYATIVASELGVHLQSGLAAGGVIAVQQIRAANNLGMIPIAGFGVIDGFGEQFGGEVAGDLGAVLTILNIAAGSQYGHGPGSKASVNDIVVVGQLLSGDGDGVGHVIHQMDAGEGVAFTGNILVIALYNRHAVGRIAIHAGDLVAVFQQSLEHIILSGDGSVVAPHQAIFNGNSIGLAAIFVFGLFMFFHYSGIELEFTLFGVDYSAAAVDQAVHAVVGSGVVERGIVEIVFNRCVGADYQLAGRLGGPFAGLAGFCVRARSLRAAAFHRRSGGRTLLVVGDRLLLSAGCHRKSQDPCQQQGENLFGFHCVSPSFLTYVIF